MAVDISEELNKLQRLYEEAYNASPEALDQILPDYQQLLDMRETIGNLVWICQAHESHKMAEKIWNADHSK
jgi:hypothetical protein